MSIRLDNKGLEIDQNYDVCLSSMVEEGKIVIDIGEDWYGADHPKVGIRQGFQRYTCITLNKGEAMALRDWLDHALGDGLGD